ITWRQQNKVAIAQKNKYEAITKPTVLFLNGFYHMWYCNRGSFDFRNGKDSYKIGYAFSKDMRTWQRRDKEAGITFSKNGWDSTMLAYPTVVKVNKEVYMFYNGNGFGKGGFGIAMLKR